MGMSSEGDLGSGSVFAIYCLSPHYEALKGRGQMPWLTSVCEVFADLNQYSSIKLFFFLWRLYVEASRLGMLGLAGKWRPCKEVDFNLMQVNVIIRSSQNETKKTS